MITDSKDPLEAMLQLEERIKLLKEHLEDQA